MTRCHTAELAGLQLDVALAQAEQLRHMHNGAQCYVFDEDDIPHLFAPSTGPAWLLPLLRQRVAERIGPEVLLP